MTERANDPPFISVECHPRGYWLVLMIDNAGNRTVRSQHLTETEAREAARG